MKLLTELLYGTRFRPVIMQCTPCSVWPYLYAVSATLIASDVRSDGCRPPCGAKPLLSPTVRLPTAKVIAPSSCCSYFASRGHSLPRSDSLLCLDVPATYLIYIPPTPHLPWRGDLHHLGPRRRRLHPLSVRLVGHHHQQLAPETTQPTGTLNGESEESGALLHLPALRLSWHARSMGVWPVAAFRYEGIATSHILCLAEGQPRYIASHFAEEW